MHDNERFEMFAEPAREVLRLAEEEAQRFNHHSIGPEHLLLGLVRESDGIAAEVLGHLGVELDTVRSAVESRSGHSDRVVLDTIGLTPRAKQVLELAVDEARRLNHRHIGTEHVLLGLVREGEGAAAQVLESLGVHVETVRAQTLQALTQSGRHSANDPSSRPSKTPTLDQMGIDLTARARQSTMAPVLGRDTDIERVIQVLSRPPQPRTGIRKNNVVLISEPELGIRKIAIVEGVAQRMISHDVPDVPALASGSGAPEPSWLLYCLEKLQGKRLVMLDVGLLIAGTTSQSEFEERFNKIIEEVRSSPDCIIFIDEPHALVAFAQSAYRAAEGRVDVAPIRVPALARGDIQCIGATTLDEYRTYVENDPALQRRFQEVIVHAMITDGATLDPSSSGAGSSRSMERETCGGSA
jgi:ATP-dependent Clp protease ATP-binding subunit ClpC